LFVCLFVSLLVGAGQKVPFDVFVEAQVSRSPGADVGGGEPSPGADVGGVHVRCRNEP
jgi:hypothetical protein